MSSLLLLNGSPRGERSNSMRMLAWVAQGWQRAGGQAPQVLHLARPATSHRLWRPSSRPMSFCWECPSTPTPCPASSNRTLRPLRRGYRPPRPGKPPPPSDSWCSPASLRRCTRGCWSAIYRNWRSGSTRPTQGPSYAARENRCSRCPRKQPENSAAACAFWASNWHARDASARRN